MRLRCGLATRRTTRAWASFTGAWDGMLRRCAPSKRPSVCSPIIADAYNRLGAAHLLTGNERAALEDFRQAVRLGGASPAYGNIGLLEYRAGRHDAAVRAYEHAVQQRPNDPVMWRNMGDAYAKLGRTADARRAYERGLEVTDRMLAVDARSAATLSARAVLLAKLGRADAARAAAASAVSQAPADPDVLYDRAIVLALARDPDAVPALESAIAAGYPAARCAPGR